MKTTRSALMDSHVAVFCISYHRPSASAGKYSYVRSHAVIRLVLKEILRLEPHLNVNNAGEDLYVSAHDDGLKDVCCSLFFVVGFCSA